MILFRGNNATRVALLIRASLASLVLLTGMGCGATSSAPGSSQLQNQLLQPSAQPSAVISASAPATPVSSAAPISSPALAAPSVTPAAAPAPGTTRSPEPRGTPVPAYQAAINDFAALSGYASQITAYGHLNGNVVGATITVQFQQPRQLRLQILDTNVLKGNETTLLYQGGNTVQVKAPGWASTVLTTSLNDSRLFLQDGQRFDTMTVGGILARFQVQGVQIHDDGYVNWNGHDAEVYELHLPGDAAMGIQKQLIGIELRQNYPLYAEQYGASGLMNQIVVSSYQPNPSLPAATFAI